MGDKTRFGQLSTRFLMQSLSGGRRWKRVLGFSVVGIVLVGGIAAAGVYALGANDVAALTKDWGELQTCLVGAPLTAGETPSARIRKLRLGMVGMDPAARPQKNGAAWPQSCTASASAMGMHAHAAEKGKDELTAAANAIAKELAANGDLGKPADALFKAVEVAGVKTFAAPADPTTPKVPDVLIPGWGNAGKLLGADVLSLPLILPEPAEGAAVRVLVDERAIPSGPVVCTAADADASISCARVPPELASQSPGLRLIGSSDAAQSPFLFTGDRGGSGVYRGDGKSLLAGATVYGASVAANGKAHLLVRRGSAKNLSIVEQASPGAALTDVGQLSASLIDNLNDATLAYDTLVYWTGKTPTGAPPSHLFARNVADASSQPVDIGEIQDATPAVTAQGNAPARYAFCASGATIAVRARGAKSDFISIFAGGHWSAPLTVPMPVRSGVLTCRDGEAWVTRLAHSDGTGPDHVTIDAVRCTPASCSVAAHAALFDMVHGDAQALPISRDASALAAVDGNLFIVWNAGQGGVRARFAAPDKLATTPDVLLNADMDPSTGEPTALDVSAVPAGKFALAFIRTAGGTASIKADATGKIAPLPSTFK